MNDDPIGRYLQDRARTIDLPRTDVGVIAERATRRRQRRRQVTYGMTGVALLAATSFAVITATGDDGTPVATTPDEVVDSPLEWTVVEPVAGLAYARTTAITDDGSMYSLSTAPGPADFTDQTSFASRTLYRSQDGTEWETLALPADLYATSLASDGARLYAVGTGPVGGEGVPLRITASDDGGATWGPTTDLPGEIGALQAAFGDEVHVGRPVVATHAGTTFVAVTVSAVPDVEERAPSGIDVSNGWSFNADGVEVYGPAAMCDLPAVPCGDDVPVIARLSWEQLELPEELRALIVPQLRAFASDGNGALEEVAPPVEQVAYAPALVTSDEGFILLASEPVEGGTGTQPPTRVLTSPDGRTWTDRGIAPGVSVTTVGVAGGQAIAASWTTDGRTVLNLLGPEGVRATVDPLDALDPEHRVVSTIASDWVGFGPLGWAAVLQGAEETFLVHSDAAGRTMSAVELPEELTSFGSIVGVTVTADAIIVRFVEAGDGVPGTLESQRLWVGTPAG